MAESRVYIGDEAYFPDLGRWLNDGDEVEDAPKDDPRFVTKAAARKPTKSEED